jgi:hypothetical protein
MKFSPFFVRMLRNKGSACFVAALLFLLAFLNSNSAFAQEPGDPYADRVVSFTPGDLVNPELGNLEAVLGPPDFNAETLSGFLNLGVGGSVTVAFVDNAAVDGPGPDIRIYGDPGNDERWIIEVSQDGETFLSFDDLPEMTDLDLADVGLSEVRFVRLTDDGDPARGISPGAELDAVEALNPLASPQAQQLYLRAVEPSEGQFGEELELTLWGGGFSQFDGAENVQVTIGGFEIWDVRIASDEAISIRVFIPEDAPPGPRSIEVVAVFGPNEQFATGLEGGFFVRGQGPGIPSLRGLNPREGEVDTEVELFLEGEDVSGLGDLFRVSLAGIDIPVLAREIVSNETIRIRVYLPEDTPRGGQIIAFVFENARFEQSFFVSAPPQPRFPTTTVIVIVIVVAGGILWFRFFRGRKIPTEKTTEKSTQPQVTIDFIVGVDSGTQSVELAKPSPKMAIDLRFEMQADQGEQSVELDGNSIIQGQ